MSAILESRFFNHTPENGHGGARNFKSAPTCCACAQLRNDLHRIRQAYSELEEALAIADARPGRRT